MNIQNLVLDINKKPFQVITANTGEVASRFVRISIVDKSKPVDLTGITVSLYAKKPDGNKVFNNVTIEDKTNGIILAELTSQILAVEGLVKLTLLLVKNGGKLCSKQFLLNVDRSIVDDEAIESTNEFTALVDALDRVSNIGSRFENVSSQLEQNTNNLSILNKEKINILSYSDYAVGDNWTEAVKKALEEAKNSSCKIVYFPCGTYVVNPDSIIVPNDVSLVGASETNSIIKGPGRTNLGAGIQLGVRCTISNLYIRDFEIGIKNTNYWNKIYDCKIYNNTIGIQLIDSYICKIKNNEITYNNVGLIIERQAYECIIKDNIIDNNNLGMGIYGGSNGLIISDNTIEGNRNYTTGVGCAILLKGNNHSRCKISGNWFEANGSTQDSVDVFLGSGNSTTHADVIALWNNIVDNCVPDNYKSNLSSGVLSVGAIDLSNNAHVFTKYGVFVGGYKCNIHIHDCYFKGSLDKYNEHIVITQLSSQYKELNLSVDNCNAENSDGMTTITPQILTGIKGTYVHAIDPPNGECTNILFNNKPLFIKELTLNEVLQNYSCIKLQQVKASGTATNIPNRCVLIGENKRFTTNSYYSNSSANILLGTEGNGSTTEAILTPNTENGNYFFTIGVPYSLIKYENMSSWTTINVGVLVKKAVLKTGKFYTYTQTGYEGIFYLVSLSKEQYEKNFKDVYKVIITDATYYLQGVIPE